VLIDFRFSGTTVCVLESSLVELSSSAFAARQPIPRRYSCAGEDRSPPLEWRAVPAGAVSLALIVDDPDSPVGTFTHWLARGINPDDGGLGEGERARREGRNDFRTIGYRGPCPPRGDEPHRYFFRLYALAREPAVSPGASRRELERALKDNVLAVAELVGTYER
jgi:Raf kinase inhibitor-like YbhB/YbcL family protein